MEMTNMERNLLLETISVLTENGKTWDSIVWIGSEDGFIELEEAKKLFDAEYDSWYWSAKVPTDLMIVGDNRWMTRWEYDGSECRDFHTYPQKPSNTLKVKSLVWWMRDKLKDF